MFVDSVSSPHERIKCTESGVIRCTGSSSSGHSAMVFLWGLVTLLSGIDVAYNMHNIDLAGDWLTADG